MSAKNCAFGNYIHCEVHVTKIYLLRPDILALLQRLIEKYETLKEHRLTLNVEANEDRILIIIDSSLL